MLARAFRFLLPPLSTEEALEVTSIHSIAGLLDRPLITKPPFRSPHHTSSYVSLVGGGATIRPGEVTLAHRGVLFLDEFPEFDRRSIDVLRQPLEDRFVTVSRARGSVVFPANFILIAAMNPTRSVTEQDETFHREQLRTQRKISGPIVDRIDMWIEVAHVEHEKLSRTKDPNAQTSQNMRKRIIEARGMQAKRFHSTIKTNSDMSIRDIDEYANIDKRAQDILTKSATLYKLSPRSYYRIVKLARTIADLDQCEPIEDSHVLEALQYRSKALFT